MNTRTHNTVRVTDEPRMQIGVRPRGKDIYSLPFLPCQHGQGSNFPEDLCALPFSVLLTDVSLHLHS